MQWALSQQNIIEKYDAVIVGDLTTTFHFSNPFRPLGHSSLDRLKQWRQQQQIKPHGVHLLMKSVPVKNLQTDLETDQ